MKINYYNKSALDEQYTHDSFFTGFTYEYEKKEIKFSCENWYLKKNLYFTFKNVAYCEMQSCGFWATNIDRIYWISNEDRPDIMEKLQKAEEEKTGKSTFLEEKKYFLQILIDYFTLRDPERNPVPLHWFSFASHRFAFGIHSYVLLFNLAQYSRIFILPVSIQ